MAANKKLLVHFRYPADMINDIAGHGFKLIPVIFQVNLREFFVKLIKINITAENKSVEVNLLDKLIICIIFILDIAYNLLNQIFNSYHTRRAAIFIYHNGY